MSQCSWQPNALTIFCSDESVPEDIETGDIDSGAEVSEDEPTVITPLRDDAVITCSLHKGAS